MEYEWGEMKREQEAMSFNALWYLAQHIEGKGGCLMFVPSTNRISGENGEKLGSKEFEITMTWEDKMIRDAAFRVKQNPESSDAYFELAAAYVRFNRFGEAIRAMRRAIHLEGDNWEFYVCLGDIYFELGGYLHALKCYETALSLENENPNLMINVANCLYEIGDFESAIKLYEEAAISKPLDSELLLMLATAYWQVGGEYENAAIDTAERIIALDDKMKAFAFHLLGTIYNEYEFIQKSEDAYAEARQLMPDINEHIADYMPGFFEFRDGKLIQPCGYGA